MELTGTIEEISEIQVIKSKGGEYPDFKKRELILKTEKKLDNYPSIIDYFCVEFSKDNVDILNNFAKQEEVRVSLNLRGRKWVNPEGVTKYFSSIQGWRLEKTNSSSSSSSMELTGTIEEISEIQVIKSKGGEYPDFKKRELILKTEKKLDNYPSIIDYFCVEFSKDNVDILNNFAKQEEVRVSLNLRGRKWVNPEGVTKYFSSIQGWRLEKTNSSSSSDVLTQNSENDFDPFGQNKNTSFDDLPF